MKSKASNFCGGPLAVMLALLGLAAQVFLAFLVMLIPVNVHGQVAGDSVDPSSYATSLKPGQSVTITKTVTISAGTPGSAKVDVFFLADTTGSMGTALSNVKTGAAAIMAGLSELGDVAYGVGEYKDVGDAFVYRLNQDITADTVAVQNGINAWFASGGGDFPEAQLFGLYQVANTTAWRDGSTRILIWFGDAPGHDPSAGVTEDQSIAALVAQTIKVLALDLGFLNSTGQASRIATATNGQYYSGIIPSQIVTDIQNAIITSFETYNTVSLGTSLVPDGLTVNVSPPDYTADEGPFDRSMDRTFTFDVTFTAVSPGSYSFTIPVLVDGGTMAAEQDEIQVGGLLGFPLAGYTPYTAPVSAVMDNSVLERTPIQFYVAGDVIKAFNGEIGALQYGSIYLDPYSHYWLAYKNSGGTDFFPPSIAGVRPLNYLNGIYLSYAGSPGYNYQVPQGTPVLATANGKLYIPDADPVNGPAPPSYYDTSYIDHENGWYSWYLYTTLSQAILDQISLNGYAQVTKGQVIGKTSSDRLHFEVRLNGSDHQNVRDPYKLGLWLPNTVHVEALIMLLLEDTAPPPPSEF